MKKIGFGSRLVRRSTAAAAVSLAFSFAVLLFSGRCASTPRPQPAADSSGGTLDVPPEALAGNWLFEIKMGGQTLEGSLHFVITSGVLTGTWTSADGNEYELKDIQIKGNQVTWNGDGPRGVQAATGKIDGNSMSGTMKRARRNTSGGSSGSGSSGSGDPDNLPPSGDGSSGSGGGGMGRRGGGRGGRRGARASSTSITWSAFKSAPAAPGSEQPGAAPASPTPKPNAG